MEFSLISTCILAASILVKLYMWLYNRSISKKIGSAAMAATATDSLSDACATLAVLISTFIARFTGVNIDAYAGALVALLILWGGYSTRQRTPSRLCSAARLTRSWCATSAPSSRNTGRSSAYTT